MWTHLHEQIRAKIQSEQMTRAEIPKTTVGIVELKDKTKGSEWSGMETDQAEQVDAPLNQSTKVLNKNCDTEETDASTTSK